MLLARDIPESQYAPLREKFDGIILSGGGDVDISYFNGESNLAVSTPLADRDNLELAMVHLAVETEWPLFGICRGIQVLNVALGGTLITDIPSQYKTKIVHDTPDDLGRQYLAHRVEITANTPLANIMKETNSEVNSFHHQAIKNLASGLVVTARATDGLIEAVDLPGVVKPIFGVQWHPENLQAINCHKALFVDFIRMCL